MNDDELDKLLIETARDYNEPGAVPREEMWGRIRAGRARSSLVARRSSPWIWPSVGVAAAMLLAVGVVIGRRMEHASQPVRPTVAAVPIAPANAPDSTRDSSATIITKLRKETQATDRRVRALASASEQRGASSEQRTPSSDERRATSDERSTDNLAYRLVVLQHLAGTEAMITSFRTSAKRGEMDTQIAAWSRELLSTTRMLAASPASKDPVMKRLLEDLDLVIAQIVVYSTRGTNNPDELDLIEQSINKRGVITKLRGTLPRRNFSAGT